MVKKLALTLDFKAVKPETTVGLSSVTRILVFLSSSWFIYLIISHANIEADREWVNYSFYMLFFNIIGFTTLPFIQGTYDKKEFNISAFFEKKALSLSSALKALIIGFSLILIQFITKFALTITDWEHAAYVVAASISEEMFFRIFLLSIFSKQVFRKNYSIFLPIIGIIIQSIAFTVMHVNYYDNPAMLVSVFIGGVVLGIYYYIWKDADALILGHFMVNLVVAVSIVAVYL